jgi:F-type H+-transporting ATPase subunit a
MRRLILGIAVSFGLTFGLAAQESHDDHTHDHDTHAQEHSTEAHDDHAHGESHAEGDHHDVCSCGHHAEEAYNVTNTAYHHIGDANAFHVVGDFYIPLPCIVYDNIDGSLDVFLSSKLSKHTFSMHHGNSDYAYNGYVLAHGVLKRVKQGQDFPTDKVEVCITEVDHHTVVYYEGNCYEVEGESTLDGGVFDTGGFDLASTTTSFMDFSISKKVLSMIIVFFLMLWIFLGIAKSYKTRRGMAPKGIQSLIEPIITMIVTDVAIPFIGKKYERFMPFLLSLFFFILGLNLLGQIPIFPGSGNVTGNLGFTLVLAVFTFIVVNINGNKDYWKHVFAMPGVPKWVLVILTPVEILGLFIKPFTLMLRLFANITAGHIVIISFVSLIFILGESGANIGGAGAGIGASIPLTMFMMAIELLVAFLQAFVFTLLTASYIGAAVQDHHH